MRGGVVALAVLMACGSQEPASAPSPAPPAPPAKVAAPPPAPTPPGLRLPGGVTPFAYDVRLEVDPEEPRFRGHVEITTTLAAPTDVIWLHAVGLELSSATFRDGDYTGVVSTLPGTEDMIGLQLDRTTGPGEIAIEIAYTGTIGEGQEGLFRQRDHERWFVYSQSESVFARRFVPCFDEPRYKTTWRMTLVVPSGQVALANAPAEHEEVLADGRREVRFAPIGPLPSYLLAVAVGPFTLVDAGTIGRARIPVRIAVAPSDAKRLTTARTALPLVADALERYLDRPLPWPKLDLVAIPTFFGAMENVGLVTFARPFLVDAGGGPAQRALFVRMAAHELAHQWFGNTVTHAWWDELWLTESLTELVADHVARELGVGLDDRLAHYVEAATGDEDDDSPTGALRQPITTTSDIEGTFGATAYSRGHWVLATFEQLVGEQAMRAALRGYLDEHAGGSVTVGDLARALAAASTPALGAALTTMSEHAGMPVVELALRCTGALPVLVGHARQDVTVPICVRYADGDRIRRACALVGEHTEVPLESASCPAWLVGNADGRGYYRVASSGEPPLGALATSTPLEQHALAADAVAALGSGPTSIASAARLLRGLAERREPHATLAALSIATTLDPLVPDAERPVWTAWVTDRFRGRTSIAARSSRSRPIERSIHDALLALRRCDRQPASHAGGLTILLRSLSASDRCSLRGSVGSIVQALPR